MADEFREPTKLEAQFLFAIVEGEGMNFSDAAAYEDLQDIFGESRTSKLVHTLADLGLIGAAGSNDIALTAIGAAWVADALKMPKSVREDGSFCQAGLDYAPWYPAIKEPGDEPDPFAASSDPFRDWRLSQGALCTFSQTKGKEVAAKKGTAWVTKTSYTVEEAGRETMRVIEAVDAGKMTVRSGAALKAHITRRTVRGTV